MEGEKQAGRNAGTGEPLTVGKPAAATTLKFQAPDAYPRSPVSWLEAQVALARRGYSCGSIDGVFGTQTAWAWHAFQAEEGLAETNWLDERTCSALQLDSAATAKVTVTVADLARLQPLSTTWLGKSEQSALDYETLLELVAERARALSLIHIPEPTRPY